MVFIPLVSSLQEALIGKAIKAVETVGNQQRGRDVTQVTAYGQEFLRNELLHITVPTGIGTNSSHIHGGAYVTTAKQTRGDSGTLLEWKSLLLSNRN